MNQSLTLTPNVIRDLSLYSKCKLADYLRVVDPRTVPVRGSITLDDLGNFISADAEILHRVKILHGEFPNCSATVLSISDTGGLLTVQVDGYEYRSEMLPPDWVAPLPADQDDFLSVQDQDD